MAGADDCDDWIAVVDAAPLFVCVEADEVDSALDMDDWVAELGAAESKLVVDD